MVLRRRTLPNSAEVLSVQQFMQQHGVTYCPPAFLVPIAGATPLASPVPSYDLGFFMKTAQEKVRATVSISYGSYQFRKKLAAARDKAARKKSRPRTMLPPRKRTMLPPGV